MAGSLWRPSRWTLPLPLFPPKRPPPLTSSVGCLPRPRLPLSTYEALASAQSAAAASTGKLNACVLRNRIEWPKISFGTIPIFGYIRRARAGCFQQVRWAPAAERVAVGTSVIGRTYLVCGAVGRNVPKNVSLLLRLNSYWRARLVACPEHKSGAAARMFKILSRMKLVWYSHTFV